MISQDNQVVTLNPDIGNGGTAIIIPPGDSGWSGITPPPALPTSRGRAVGNGGNNETTKPAGGSSGGTDPYFSRLADVLEGIMNQPVFVPPTGEPQIIPTQSTTTSIMPVLLAVGGAGIMAWSYLHTKKKGAGDAAS